MEIPLANKLPPTPCNDDGCSHSYCNILRNIQIEKAQQEEQEAYTKKIQAEYEAEQERKDSL
jgi:hypothetical protein